MSFFFFNDTATTEIYTLSLHDALPISAPKIPFVPRRGPRPLVVGNGDEISAQAPSRSEEHTSELQSPCNLVCRLLLEKKKKTTNQHIHPRSPLQTPPPADATTRTSIRR